MCETCVGRRLRPVLSTFNNTSNILNFFSLLNLNIIFQNINQLFRKNYLFMSFDY